jgi:hypothetical protein
LRHIGVLQVHKIGIKGGEGMSDYRRLISYIYAYEGGVKGKNAGYAKVEVRGEQCRIYVNVKNIYVGGNDICVYLLTPEAEISLGRIFVRGGNGEFRTTVDVNNVMQSGQKIDACYGLTVHESESVWQSYTTIWEDAVTQAAEAKADSTTKKTAETVLAEVTAENARKREQESGKIKSAENHFEKENLPEMPSGENEQEYPITEEIDRQLKREEEKNQDVVPWDEEPEIPQKTEPQMPQEEEQEMHQEMSNHIWNRMQKRYARVRAFDYEDGCEILLICPQDIGLLPRETWIYGNNSFLLHGYYNYRHLILARLENPNGNPRYLLGVPGNYFRSEKNMAALFGFTHFILAKKQPEPNGRFGYWYADIRL